jgi:hypothetical protein
MSEITIRFYVLSLKNYLSIVAANRFICSPSYIEAHARYYFHITFFLYNQGFNNLVTDGIIKYVIRSTMMITPKRSLNSNGRVSVNCLISGSRVYNSTKIMPTVTIAIL